MSQVKPERSFWRHSGLSLFHRELGVSCPMTDIDFLAVEAYGTRPAAIIEYKHEYSSPINLNSWQCQTLNNLCSAGKLPLYVCRYADDLTWFEIFPANSVAFAKTAFKFKQDDGIYKNSFMLNREGYVKFQYWNRGFKEVPPEIMSAAESYKGCTRQIDCA